MSPWGMPANGMGDSGSNDMIWRERRAAAGRASIGDKHLMFDLGGRAATSDGR